jgi:putative two-component system response regulator
MAENPQIAAEIKNADILVVDDNAMNVRLVVDLLTHDGYTSITSETDPRRAVERCRERRFDLLILDIRMPHLDGHKVMELLREIYGDDYLPVLILTAQIDDDTKRRALASGAKDFLTKPILPWELLNRVYNLLEVRVLYNRMRGSKELLEQRVYERTHELEDTRLDVLRRLAIAGEFRDNETGMHVMRMSRFTQVIARAIGWSEDQHMAILNASPLHDIGKIGIPDGILLKPGRLDDDELKIMKSHAEIGARILERGSFPLLQLARTIAITHHEKWDGSGYPNGLAGEDIPLPGRIVAVADVFDAVTSARPYKPAWDIDRAVALLREGSGSHFDPELVAVFLNNLKEILDIRERFKD